MRTVRRAWRNLRRSPAFASAAIASLALGIGANSAIFTLTDALLFRPLPVKDPGALLHLASVDPTGRTVVGVTDRRFSGLLVGFPARLIFPIAQLVFPGVVPAFILHDVIARTKPGERVEQVRSRIDTEWPQLLNAATPPNVIGTLRGRFVARRPLAA